VSVPVTLRDRPWKGGGREGSNFSARFRNYNQTVWPRMTEFGVVTKAGRSTFLGVSHVPMCRGASVHKIFGIPYIPTPKRFDTERRNLACSTYGAGACFLMVRHSPVSRGGSPASPKLLDLLHARAQYEKRQPDLARW